MTIHTIHFRYHSKIPLPAYLLSPRYPPPFYGSLRVLGMISQKYKYRHFLQIAA